MEQVIDNKQGTERPIMKSSKKKAARMSYIRLTDKEIEKITKMEAEAKRKIKNLLDDFWEKIQILTICTAMIHLISASLFDSNMIPTFED